MAPLLNLLDDHKVISGHEGHNEAKGITGGYFHIEPMASDLGFKLIYDHEKNDDFFRDIVDTVVPQPDGSFYGTLFKGGKRKFNFSLHKT
ncbi:MAG: hypothetical protein KKA54_13150 [Proteobacteria bacterium]|nr:hypothetical protein [Pseudomonadota bacterium]